MSRRLSVSLTLVGMLAAMMLLGAPVAMAATNLSWSASTITKGGSTIGTIHLDSSQCPAGGNFLFAINVADPNGGTSTVEQNSIPCGTDATFTYPSSFFADPNTPSTATCGTYTVSWAFISHDASGGDFVVSPTINGPNFTVSCQTTTGVPQFPLGFAVVLAIGLPALLVMRRIQIRR